MAAGDIVTIGDWVSIEILATRTTVNSPPASLTAGVSTDQIKAAFGGIIPDDLSILVASTAGSATMTATVRLWVMDGTLAGRTSIGCWTPAGVGTAAAKGILNAGAAIEETAADLINHKEPVSLVAHSTRVYPEITAIGGTATSIAIFLTGSRRIGSY